jgi:ActR/RegA family two-component response regulator
MQTDPPLILIFEQDEHFFYLIQRYGAACECRVKNALSLHPSGQKFSAAFAETPVVILVDLQIAKGSAVEIAEVSQSLSQQWGIPLLVCSSSQEAFSAWEGLADGYLLKPVMYVDFIQGLLQAGIDLPSLSAFPGDTETSI